MYMFWGYSPSPWLNCVASAHSSCTMHYFRWGNLLKCTPNSIINTSLYLCSRDVWRQMYINLPLYKCSTMQQIKDKLHSPKASSFLLSIIPLEGMIGKKKISFSVLVSNFIKTYNSLLPVIIIFVVLNKKFLFMFLKSILNVTMVLNWNEALIFLEKKNSCIS